MNASFIFTKHRKIIRRNAILETEKTQDTIWSGVAVMWMAANTHRGDVVMWMRSRLTKAISSEWGRDWWGVITVTYIVTWLAAASVRDGKLLCLRSQSAGRRWERGTRRIMIILSPSILWISSGGRCVFSRLTGGGGLAMGFSSISFFLSTSLVDLDLAISVWLLEAGRFFLALTTLTPALVAADVSFLGGGLFSCFIGFGGSRSFLSTCKLRTEWYCLQNLSKLNSIQKLEKWSAQNHTIDFVNVIWWTQMVNALGAKKRQIPCVKPHSSWECRSSSPKRYTSEA